MAEIKFPLQQKFIYVHIRKKENAAWLDLVYVCPESCFAPLAVACKLFERNKCFWD